jgi:rod shape determining protein RodA
VNGARSWFAAGSFQLQPAELAKVATILALAGACARRRGGLQGRDLVVTLGLAAVPTGLVLLQPDLGSALVFTVVAMAMLLVAGARASHLAGLVALAVVVAIGVLQLDLLEGYQRDRLTAFASEGSSDRQGVGFQLDQSMTTVAAGGLVGTGLFQGTQTRLGFVPEQQTDFIFTVVGEELGFVGSVAVLALYAVVAWRVWRTGLLAREPFATLVCTGVLAMIAFHVFQNMGMAMGIMPITGIPLPLMSYGGSATVTVFAGLGLVLNVHARRFT